METKHMKTMFNIGYSHFIGGSTDKQKKESYNNYHKHKGWKINDDLEMFIYFDKEILLNVGEVVIFDGLWEVRRKHYNLDNNTIEYYLKEM